MRASEGLMKLNPPADMVNQFFNCLTAERSLLNSAIRIRLWTSWISAPRIKATGNDFWPRFFPVGNRLSNMPSNSVDATLEGTNQLELYAAYFCSYEDGHRLYA